MFKDKVYKPLVVPKGWGKELHIVNKKEYCGKVLVFEKGKKCSFHYHIDKDEVFYLIKGKLLLRISDEKDFNTAEEFELNEGECFYIYPGLVHQMEALEDSDLIEYSTEHRDSDSHRIVRGD